MLKYFEKLDAFIISELEYFFQGMQLLTGKDNFFFATCFLYIDLALLGFVIYRDVFSANTFIAITFLVLLVEDIRLMPTLKERVYLDLRNGHKNCLASLLLEIRFLSLCVCTCCLVFVVMINAGNFAPKDLVYAHCITMYYVIYSIVKYLMALTPFPEEPNLTQPNEA